MDEIAYNKEIYIENAPLKILLDLKASKEYLNYLVKDGVRCIDKLIETFDIV